MAEGRDHHADAARHAGPRRREHQHQARAVRRRGQAACASAGSRAATFRAHPTRASIRSRRWRCSPRPCRISTRLAPVDVIVPCAHGSALALLDESRRARFAGDGLFRRAAGGDRQRVPRHRTALFGSLLPGQPDGADARPAAVLAADGLCPGFRAGANDPALGPVFRLAHERPGGVGQYGARRANPARRCGIRRLLVAGARARLGPAVRAARSPL